MAKKKTYPPAPVPETKDLSELSRSAVRCKACPLYEKATQIVFGQGPQKAPIMIVGEQPGNQEDKKGLPFVGPAGGLLNICLEEAGLARETAYMTNAVKHFKFEQTQGKARLHKKPNTSEVRACRPWLESEWKAVKPKLVIALGATAAQSLLQRTPHITAERGKIIRDPELPFPILMTWHPSALLRSYSREESSKKRDQLVKDLKLAVAFIKKMKKKFS